MMKAKYDENKVYKPVCCDYCNKLIGMAYVNKDEEPNIVIVHSRKRGNCVVKHGESLLPKIPIIGDAIIPSKKEKIDASDVETAKK